MTSAPALLSVEGVDFDYPVARRVPFGKPRYFRALHSIDLSVAAGESVAVVGESGSGKTTLARVVLGFGRPSGGRVMFQGQSLYDLRAREQRVLRRGLQMVFQDPYGSLNPRFRIGRSIAEPFDVAFSRMRRAERRERIARALDDVGLSPADAQRYPHEFSGGQRQRIAIARALITRPALIVADEPVSALDVSVQAQVLNLMLDLQRQHGVAYVFISHDLSVVRHLCERVAIVHDGRIVETGETERVFAAPAHAYTKRLISALPLPGTRWRRPRAHSGWRDA